MIYVKPDYVHVKGSVEEKDDLEGLNLYVPEGTYGCIGGDINLISNGISVIPFTGNLKRLSMYELDEIAFRHENTNILHAEFGAKIIKNPKLLVSGKYFQVEQLYITYYIVKEVLSSNTEKLYDLYNYFKADLGYEVYFGVNNDVVIKHKLLGNRIYHFKGSDSMRKFIFHCEKMFEFKEAGSTATTHHHNKPQIVPKLKEKLQMKTQQIIDRLLEDWDAIVSLGKGGKYIVYLNEVEYTLNNDEELADFYEGFCQMNKYLG